MWSWGCGHVRFGVWSCEIGGVVLNTPSAFLGDGYSDN